MDGHSGGNTCLLQTNSLQITVETPLLDFHLQSNDFLGIAA
jgi:hypothetical protein